MAASILIADDDAVQRRLVENMVQKCGYETMVVDSGDAAIALLTAPDGPVFDAMVLDLVMPGPHDAASISGTSARKAALALTSESGH